MKLYMVSELSISCLLFTLIPPPGQCAGGTHPTGMHSCLYKKVLAAQIYPTRVFSHTIKLQYHYVRQRSCNKITGFTTGCAHTVVLMHEHNLVNI